MRFNRHKSIRLIHNDLEHATCWYRIKFHEMNSITSRMYKLQLKYVHTTISRRPFATHWGGIIQNEILKRAYSFIRLFICYDLNDFFYYTLKIQNCNHHFKCDLSIRLDFYFNLSFSLFPTKWFLDIFFGTHIIFHIFQNLMILPIPQRKGSLWLTTQTRHVNRYNSQQRTIQLKL